MTYQHVERDGMTPVLPLTWREAFFFANCGYSYGDGETRVQGLTRCALELAWAEQFAECQAWFADWSIDSVNSSDFSDDPEPWQLWVCLLRNGGPYGEVLESLSGIDFGRDGEPGSGNYARIVVAELAQQAMANECGITE